MPALLSPADDVADPKVVRATLWAGFFTNGVWDMLSVAVPLYAVAVQLSPADVGFVVAARSVLPSLLSIHGGIVMDYWGTRRVILGVSCGSCLLALLYPTFGWFVPLVLLQLMLGLATSLAQAGSQTWSLQTSQDIETLARFSLVSRIATFFAPLLVGIVWDHLGAWATFACISLWAAGTVAAALRAPRSDEHSLRESDRRPSLLLPDWKAHKEAFAMAAVPAVAFVLAVSFLRNAPGAIQSSLYVVFLGDAGLSGTSIGVLVSICEFAGILGSMTAAPLERVIRAPALVVICIALSIAAIASTPILVPAFALLVLGAATRGVAQGLSQPLVYSLLGKAAPRESHGVSVGLRNTVSRLASIMTPAIMGIIAETWGIEWSFYVIGAVLLTGTAALAIAAPVLTKNA